MTLADSLAALMFVAIVAYALLAGADFGAGFWDLVAGGPERGRRQREHIAHTIGPVWESNHVWLIFALVLLWTCFPDAFRPIAATLYVPLFLAAVGIILRGAGFAFRKEVEAVTEQRFYGALFAASSVITPFFLGAMVGGIASGRIPVEGRGDAITSWLNPTGVLGGMLAVIVCAFLAAVYLAADAHRLGEPDLAERFRARALGAAIVAGVVAVAGIFVLAADAEDLFDGLTSGADLVVIPLSAVFGLGTIALLWRRRLELARVTAALAVIAVLVGWGIAQYPDLFVGGLEIEEAAGARETLVAVWVAVSIGLVLLVPSLAYLFYLVRTGELGEGGDDRATGSEAAG